MNKMIKLIRVIYGEKNTPKDLREYRIDGAGPVGTISEYKEKFPNDEFEIIDWSVFRACEWCGIILNDDNLYSYYGFEDKVGPICKECAHNFKKSDE